MEKEDDLRWKQRFQNFEKALHFLENAIKIESPDITQKAGLIQFFEISFELSWKLLKDYLEEEGFKDIRSPKDSIKTAFEIGLINDGHTWLDALNDRNLTSHTYDEVLADKVIMEIIHNYYPLLNQLYKKLNQEI
jgi:nucleotidyltransferase substrate binding protein (TIGR01987 family)